MKYLSRIRLGPLLPIIFIFMIQGCGGTNIISEEIAQAPEETVETPEEITTNEIPNILLIISDDQGLDASAQYNLSNDLPNTPNIDQLANEGIIFENAWATPACTTTRGALITGQHGINSGITTVPFRMNTDSNTIQRALSNDATTQNISNAVFGKWHIAGNDAELNHPNLSGVSHYYGNIKGTLNDYELWDVIDEGIQNTSMRYHTTDITDKAIDWISLQNTPWFAWVAYSAPHSPFHLPPEELHSRDLIGTTEHINNNKREYFLAAIEAMDYEIGRLIDSLDDSTRDNTLIIFLGDNGSPNSVIDTSNYTQGQAKGSLYEGGVRVPMVISGAKVTRQGVRETSLINAVDIYPTILSATGASDQPNIDGESFYELLSNADADTRDYNYTEFISDNVTGWAVTDGQYKLIELADGSQQLYDLHQSLTETDNLITNAGYVNIIIELSNYAATIRNENIAQITETVNDITDTILDGSDTHCTSYADELTSNVTDINNSANYQGDLLISVENDECIFTTNLTPNHDFNDADRSFPNDFQPVEDEYRITVNPTFANSNSPLLLTQDNAILLNGVKVDLLAAGCFNVADERTGCNDINQPWRFDPLSPTSGFSVDSHNAHTQPNGAYHYHGSPNALFDESSASVVIGFAADGFPIFGSYISENGAVRAVTSSYTLKTGNRPDTENSPGGDYDGTFRDDYEYTADHGDLDECNGMTRNGSYGYYVTNEFPYMMACFKGTPNISFNK